MEEKVTRHGGVTGPAAALVTPPPVSIAAEALRAPAALLRATHLVPKELLFFSLPHSAAPL